MAFSLLNGAHTQRLTSAPALTAVHCPNRVGPVAGAFCERVSMYEDDKASLAKLTAEYE